MPNILNSFELDYTISLSELSFVKESLSSSDKTNWSMLLDSGHSNNCSQAHEQTHANPTKNSRFDIFCALPCITLVKMGETVPNAEKLIIKYHTSDIKNQNWDNQRPTHYKNDPLDSMRQLLEFVSLMKHKENNPKENNLKECNLKEYSLKNNNLKDNSLKDNSLKDNSLKNRLNEQSEIPFNGGWMGYFSYEFGKSFELAESKQEEKANIPHCQFGLYRWALITDHKQKRTTLYNFGLPDDKWSKVKSLVCSKDRLNNSNSKENAGSPFQLINKFNSEIEYSEYQKSFDVIQENIKAGNCYQVNYAHQFCADFKGNSFEAYQTLSKVNQSPFSAFLNCDEFKILSLSPERFIKLTDNKVLTQPIKGTAPRSPRKDIDDENAMSLLSSEKDRAENLMIVDLLRNDLSRTADIGSVKVPELFGLYSFESVHHLISTITSELKEPFDAFDLMATCLPGGSITGAPKIAAMAIIEQMERSKRGIYCGVIGYFDFLGNMDTNICIRTLLAKEEKLYCSAGGGIVFDSKVELEYQETFHKISKLIPVLEEQFLVVEEKSII